MSLALQSLASSPSSACSAADGAALRRKADDARPDDSRPGEAAKAPKGRHALLAALTDALEGLAAAPAGNPASAPADEPAPADRESKHALHAFVHELFAALRPAESEGRTGRGFAWGRTSSADLAQRLDALVQRLQGGAAPAPSEPDAVAPPDAPAPAATAAAATPAPDTPATATASQAAPPVDSSATPPTPIGVDPLLSAFQELLAVRQPAEGGGVSAGGTDALVAFLQRMAQSLGGHAASGSAPPGTLLDVTA